MPQEHDDIMREIQGPGHYGGRPRSALTIETLQAASKGRADRWHDTPESKWSLLEWAGAMCGEAGEAANFAKKIKRLDSKMYNIDRHAEIMAGFDDRRRYAAALVREVADTILYSLCIFNELEVDAEEVLRAVFNEKSEEYGFPERV